MALSEKACFSGPKTIRFKLAMFSFKRQPKRIRVAELKSFGGIMSFAISLSFCGCGHAPQNPNDADLNMWRSPNSSLQQRADAVTKLFPKGTSREEIERVLARKGEWTHYHGPSFDAINNRQLPDHDYWRLVYDFPGGGVSLEFEPATAFGDRFLRASPFQTLSSSPLTNSP